MLIFYNKDSRQWTFCCSSAHLNKNSHSFYFVSYIRSMVQSITSFPSYEELKNGMNIREILKNWNVVRNTTGNRSNWKSREYSKYAMVMCVQVYIVTQSSTQLIQVDKTLSKKIVACIQALYVWMQSITIFWKCSYARKRSFSCFHKSFIIHISRIC